MREKKWETDTCVGTPPCCCFCENCPTFQGLQKIYRKISSNIFAESMRSGMSQQNNYSTSDLYRAGFKIRISSLNFISPFYFYYISHVQIIDNDIPLSIGLVIDFLKMTCTVTLGSETLYKYKIPSHTLLIKIQRSLSMDFHFFSYLIWGTTFRYFESHFC